MLNFAKNSYNYLGNAVTKIELIEGGQKVDLTFKSGTKETVAINDIQKAKDEKILVETFEEPYLFPLDIQGKGDDAWRVYVYGHGQEAVKNGEVFRAIINGLNIN